MLPNIYYSPNHFRAVEITKGTDTNAGNDNLYINADHSSGNNTEIRERNFFVDASLVFFPISSIKVIVDNSQHFMFYCFFTTKDISDMFHH